MNTDWTGIYTCKECHKTESRSNHTATDHKEGEQLEDRRNVDENSCNSGDGTDQTGPILDVYDDDDDCIEPLLHFQHWKVSLKSWRQVLKTGRASHCLLYRQSNLLRACIKHKQTRMVLDIRESHNKIKSNLNFPVRSSILFEISSFWLYCQCLFEVKALISSEFATLHANFS